MSSGMGDVSLVPYWLAANDWGASQITDHSGPKPQDHPVKFTVRG